MKLCKIENIIFEKEKYIKMIMTIAIKLKIFNYRIVDENLFHFIILYFVCCCYLKIVFLFFLKEDFYYIIY